MVNLLPPNVPFHLSFFGAGALFNTVCQWANLNDILSSCSCKSHYRRIGIIDRRRGPSSLGLPEGVKESVVKVGIVHGSYPASDLATAARSYVLL